MLAHGAHGAYLSLLSEFLQIPASAVDLLQEFVEIEAPVETFSVLVPVSLSGWIVYMGMIFGGQASM